ncbi:unnamed protein product [Didymodactylos carnosus]|uniref:E2 ubiquitin-conjugating enzyme n=1 Tax=Didymodactylos carnosus TaxID=1234261 RepID=A0A815V6G6_9BILA|nr:unnamed protein product [Didymodactylos carnosus]CAF1531878.1 unnamed protein product [Didymodactylos carnosus]CAF4177534.1 unnamed protein product [Didymodactylos carnosus]CAF4391259.1 unnamed protein product [Didymodactylos carnosus]
MAALKLLAKIWKQLQEDPPECFSVSPVDGDLYHWKGILFGPKDTPYEGGMFKVDIQMDETFPFKPPAIRFETKIYHPNISSTGDVYLDVLDSQWSPALYLRATLISVCALIGSPNGHVSIDPEIGRMCVNEREKFDQIAREWTLMYAVHC